MDKKTAAFRRTLPSWSFKNVPPRPTGMDAVATRDLAVEFVYRLLEDPGFELNRELVDIAFDAHCSLKSLTEIHWNRYSQTIVRDAMIPVLPWLTRLRTSGGPGAALTVVDIGCGQWNPYAIGFACLLAGATRAFAFDLNTANHPARAAWYLSQMVAGALIDPESLLPKPHTPTREQILQRTAGFDLAALSRGDLAGIDGQRLAFAQRDAGDLGLPTASVDFTRSSAFFEHVADVDAVIRELARVMRRGAIGFHHIDAVDHRSYSSPEFGPLDYLQVPTAEGFLELRGPGTRREYQNRLRPHQWVERFEAHGFRIESFVPMRPAQVTEAMRASFAEPFRGMSIEQLSPTAANFVIVRT